MWPIDKATKDLTDYTVFTFIQEELILLLGPLKLFVCENAS